MRRTEIELAERPTEHEPTPVENPPLSQILTDFLRGAGCYVFEDDGEPDDA